MKRVKIIVLFLLVSCISNYNWGQEKKNMIAFGGVATRYEGVEPPPYSFYGYYEHPAGPGLEALYYRCLTPNTRIGSGLTWQYGKVASYTYRFRFDEIGVPLVFQTGFTFFQNYRFFITTGAVFGDAIHISSDTMDKYEAWYTVPASIYYPPANDKFFIDYYLDAGFSRSIFKDNEISLGPFLKNRANTSWLNRYEKRFMYGIKLTYSIKL